MTSKQRALGAVNGEPVDRVPVFPLLMFFAARRAGISYRTFATEGEAMASAQVNVFRKYGVDVVTACSDAFRIAADLKGVMVYPENAPPHLAGPLIKSASDVDRLFRPDPLAKGGRMAGRVEAVKAMTREIGDECLVLGWVDMPFAEACSLCGVSEFMMMLVDNPELAHRLLDFLTEIVMDFAIAQLDAGAPMVGAGDAAASLISSDFYREFALPYERRVFEAIHRRGGLGKLHICGNTTALLDDMSGSGADLFNVDHLVPFGKACEVYGEASLCFKGNLNPVADILQSDAATCQRKALELLRSAKNLRYMLSAGCEIPGETKDEVFHAFCEAPKIFASEKG